MKHTKLKIYIYLEGGVRHEVKRYIINCNSVYGIGVSICQFRCMPCGRKENCLWNCELKRRGVVYSENGKDSGWIKF